MECPFCSRTFEAFSYPAMEQCPHCQEWFDEEIVNKLNAERVIEKINQEDLDAAEQFVRESFCDGCKGYGGYCEDYCEDFQNAVKEQLKEWEDDTDSRFHGNQTSNISCS